MHRRAAYPGERMIVRAEQRREWRAGLSATCVIFGATIASWLALSAPQDPSRLTLIPAAEAASLFAEQPGTSHRLNRAGPVQEAQATATPEQQPGDAGEPMQTSTPLTHEDLVRVQARLKALGYDPGTADGRSDKRTLEALNEYRKSLGLQPTRSVDRQAVAPLTP